MCRLCLHLCILMLRGPGAPGWSPQEGGWMKQGWDPTRSSSSHEEFGQSLEQSPHVPLGAQSPAQDSGINKVGWVGKYVDFLYLRFWRQSKGFWDFLAEGPPGLEAGPCTERGCPSQGSVQAGLSQGTGTAPTPPSPSNIFLYKCVHREHITQPC